MPANCQTPPFVLLDYSTASVSGGNVRLEWATLVEFKNTGFNLWRAMKDEAGKFINLTKLNGSLILAKGDTQESASYSFEDNSAAPSVTYYYAIEDIDTNGERSRHDEIRVEVKPLSISPAVCMLYGVQDQGLNDSVFFAIDLETNEVTQLGEMYEGYDIEAMAIHRETNIIYVASGNNTSNGLPKGHLYMLDAETGSLISLGATGFKEIGGLAFDSEGVLWAWAKGDGLAKLDIETAQGSLILPSEALLEDLSSSRDGKLLYGCLQVELWSYKPDTDALTLKCSNLALETEAVEMLLDGKLLLGRHQDKTLLLHALDIPTCEMVASLNIPIPYNDVEGLALPHAACMP